MSMGFIKMALKLWCWKKEKKNDKIRKILFNNFKEVGFYIY